jgi:hypothetical protein
MRHAILRGAWRPLLALFGATRDRAHIDVGSERIEVCFGWFQADLPRGDLLSASRSRWPWYGGIGWRIGARTLALIGALRGVVELRLRAPHRTRIALIPLRYDRLFISLEDPEAFLADLGLG